MAVSVKYLSRRWLPNNRIHAKFNTRRVVTINFSARYYISRCFLDARSLIVETPTIGSETAEIALYQIWLLIKVTASQSADRCKR